MPGKETVNRLFADQYKMDINFDRSAKDYRFDFQTPIPVCKYMAALIPTGSKTILEPSPGAGNIVSVLKDHYKVTAPNDFFLLNKNQSFDCVVMNPPFSSKQGILTNAPDGFQFVGMRLGWWFLIECMKMSDHVIALMPWFTLTDSDSRTKILHNYGIKSVTHLPRKTFKGSRIQTCIIELDRKHKGPTELKVFNF